MFGTNNERIAADIWSAYDSIQEQIGAAEANQADLVASMKRIVQLVER